MCSAGSKLTRRRDCAFTTKLLVEIELTLRCQMSDLHFKFEEDRAKTTVTIESDRYFGQTDSRADRQTDRQTDKHSSDFISFQ